LLGTHPISVSICYEDIFPGQIRMLMSGGQEGRIPEAMFNLTEDSWYGNTVEPMEHVALASFRAIEHRRPLVRSTTTGISAIIDPVGRFAKRTGQWTKETLVGRIPMMQGRTAYAVLGDWLGCLCAILVLLSIGRGYQLIRRCPENKHITDRKEKKRSKRPKKS
jgi:apolipoprotein N-acyltransferase